MPLREELKSQGNFLFKYRSFLPLLLLPVAMYLIGEQCKSGDRTYGSQVTGLQWLAIAICLFGLFIRIFTVGYTPKNTSGRNTKEGQVADTVNRSGMYSIVRHPLYLGNFFMWLGIAVLTGHFWFILCFCLFYWLYYERIMYAEEHFLQSKFGDLYQGWASETPAFIPRLSRWQAPHMPFSVKKVFKKEKNGLFAIFLLVYLYDLWEQFTCNEGPIDFCAKPTLCYLAILTGVIYLVLKIVKKSTTVLSEVDR
jgi:protein-S-isoprenylcysteine O-methyltransferase Ste14